MPFARVRELDIWYDVRGAGPPLLFLGGIGGDLLRSSWILDSPLARRFTLLAFDPRGLGRTRGPDRPCATGDYADDAAALLATLGRAPWAVLGFSFGGLVAQELALRHPARVSRLALASTSAGGAGGSSYPLHELFLRPAEEAARRLVELRDSRRGPAWQAAHPEEFHRLLEEAGTTVEQAATPGVRRQLEARRAHDAWGRLPRLSRPVLVCGGRHDRISPPANLAALRDRIPGAELELFEGGHRFPSDDPEAFPRLGEFLLGPAPAR